MATGKQFPVQIVIGAVDEITYKLMAINEKIKKVTDPLNKMGTAFKNLGAEMGIGKLGAAMGNVAEKARGFGAELGKSLAVVGGLAYGLYKLVTGTSDLASHIAEASDRIGISTDAFQAWNYQAVQSGLKTEELEGLLLKFSKAMGTAAYEGGEMADVFQALGIRIKDSHGQARRMEDVLPEVAKAMQKIQNPTLRNKVLMDLFGKSGAKVGEFLTKATASGKDFAKVMEELKAQGVIISSEDLEKSRKFGDDLAALKTQFDALKVSALSELMPQLIEMLRKASVWLSANQGLVREWAREFAKDLPNIIAGIGNALRALGTVMGWAGSIVSWLNDMFGTANVTAGLLAFTIFGKTIVSFVQLGASLFQLAGQAIPLVIRGIALLMPAFQALTALLFANPIGIWIALGAAIIGIGVLLYKKWEPFRNLIDGIVDKVKAVGGWIGEKLGFTASSGAAAPQGQALGAAAVTEAAVAGHGRGAAGSESRVVVDFNNMPRGTRVKTEKADTPLDLNLGYSLAAGVP